MSKQEWQTKKIQHGYPNLEEIVIEKHEKKLIKNEHLVIPDRKNSVFNQLDKGMFKKIEMLKQKSL